MDLTTIIFRDLAAIAQWAFRATSCQAGKYTLTEVIRNKEGQFTIDGDNLDFSALPECAERISEDDDLLRLSYNNGASVYEFRPCSVFRLLNAYKRIATEDITAKERTQLTTMVKQGEQPGELVAIVELPKSLTKQVAKAANKDKYQARFSGLFVDEGGYIMATDGYVINVCKAVVSSDIKLGAFSLPIDFAKRHDGDTVEIYRRVYTYFAKSGEDVVECDDDRRPDYSRCFPHVSKKGRIELQASDLIKSLKRMEGTVTLSSSHGQLSVASSIGQTSIPGTCQSDFASKYEIERLSQIMPACSVAFFTTSSTATIFIGSGVMSAVMPSLNDTYYNFATDEQERTDAFELMETLEPQPKTKRKAARQQPAPEPVQVTEEKPTEPNHTAEPSPIINYPNSHTVIKIATAWSVQHTPNIGTPPTSQPSRKHPCGHEFSPVTASTSRLLVFIRPSHVVPARRKYGGLTAHVRRTAFRQFTRGSTITHHNPSPQRTTNTPNYYNNPIINHYPGELYCRGA